MSKHQFTHDFENFFDGFLFNKPDNGFPFYNLYKDQKSDKYIIELAVAGYNKDNLHVTLEDGQLTIEGGFKQESDNIIYERKGITFKHFRKRFRAFNMKLEKAKLENGILKINLIPEKNKEQSIEIE